MVFSTKVLIISNLFVIIEVPVISDFFIIEISTAIKAPSEKHQNIIKFSINSALDVDTDYVFRQYHYVITIMNLLFKQKSEIGYLNSKCAINLMNRIFLIKTHFKLFIKIMTNFVIVRGIESNKHKTSKYVIIPLYFSDENVTAILTSREIHIINNFKTNVLININIIISKKINILTFQAKAEIDNYDINVFIKIRIRDRAVVHSMYIKKFIIISPHIQLAISIHHINLLIRDFFFEFDQLDLTLYAHFVDSSLPAILTKNDSNQYVKISKNLRLDTIQKADFDNCYHIIFRKRDVVEFINRRFYKKHRDE